MGALAAIDTHTECNPIVLVADDEELIRKLLKRALGRAGYDVRLAPDGRSAIQFATEHKPQLAVVDLSMPFVHGFAVVRHLKEMYGEDLHVIVLSGNSDADSRLRAFDEGADDFIAKPVHLPELLKRLRVAQRTHSARLEAQHARERAERLLVYASEADSLLAHDLNNGFAIALSNAGYIRDTADLDEEQSAALRSAISALRRMASLAGNLVDVSRLEDRAMTARGSIVRVDQLIAAIADVHEPSIKSAGASLVTECSADLLAYLDGALMERVLHNLVGNAVRYVASAGTVRVVATEESNAAGERRLHILVHNTGPRVPASIAHLLFEKYRTGTDGKAMRGMGLYFCRLAAEAHGGEIRLDTSRTGTGFVVDIPLTAQGEQTHG